MLFQLPVAAAALAELSPTLGPCRRGIDLHFGDFVPARHLDFIRELPVSFLFSPESLSRRLLLGRGDRLTHRHCCLRGVDGRLVLASAKYRAVVIPAVKMRQVPTIKQRFASSGSSAVDPPQPA
jgi:hypothetical protein